MDYFYQQPYSNVVKQKVEASQNQQSVLQLVYHTAVDYASRDYFSLLVLNGMLGAFSHSRLFTEIREKAGLSYHLGSYLDSFTGSLQVYAGIDRDKREQTLNLINKQLNDFKMGCFSSSLVKQTKDLIKTNTNLLADNQKALVDMTYHQTYCGSLLLDDWLTELDRVSKPDLVRMANRIRLQAIYFLEGR